MPQWQQRRSWETQGGLCFRFFFPPSDMDSFPAKKAEAHAHWWKIGEASEDGDITPADIAFADILR